MKPGPKKGYKQTPEHIEKRKRFGAAHPNWAGDAITEKSGRSRAIRAFPIIGCCIKCGKAKAERHHKNGNTADNRPENIEIVCRRCHMKEDGRLDRFKELALSNLRKAQDGAVKYRRSITHCPNGHPYAGENLYVNPKGSRNCRQCLNEYKRAKRKSMAAEGCGLVLLG